MQAWAIESGQPLPGSGLRCRPDATPFLPSDHARPCTAGQGIALAGATGLAGAAPLAEGPRLADRPSACLGHRTRSEEHTSELQSRQYLVCRLLLEKKKVK